MRLVRVVRNRQPPVARGETALVDVVGHAEVPVAVGGLGELVVCFVDGVEDVRDDDGTADELAVANVAGGARAGVRGSGRVPESVADGLDVGGEELEGKQSARDATRGEKDSISLTEGTKYQAA